MKVWLGPERPHRIAAAIEEGGATLAEPDEADAIVWVGWPPDGIRDLLHPGVRWVQLHSAGVDAWFDGSLLDDERTWTRVLDVYSTDVAEHAVALLLAGARRLGEAARRTTWEYVGGEPIAGRTVGIVGAGSVGCATLARLRPFGVRLLALTRSGREIEGADRSLGAGDLDDLLAESDYVVLAAPLTRETVGLIGRRELELLGPRGWLVNVARGRLVVTEDLVEVLASGALGGACLDVTDPEPLPDGHPLWSFPNVLITPHVANPPETWYEPLADLVEENVRRFCADEPLLGVIETAKGY